MNIRALILVPLLMVGCTCAHPRSTASFAASLRTPDSFRFVGATTTVQDVVTRFGKPDLDVGYGQQGYGYRLSDGSFVIIGFADPSQILYVRHGQEILYERK
jgi:hypothetical protein